MTGTIPEKCAVSGSRNATEEHHLHKLSKDSSPFVRATVASNPNMSNLDELTNDDNAMVRRAVTTNPNATKQHLDTIIKDKRKPYVSSIKKIFS